ncbi:MAG: AI-2E family transporter [Candidatus Sericytochromatia bacterium]
MSTPPALPVRDGTLTDRRLFFTVFLIAGFGVLFYFLYRLFAPFLTSLIWGSMIVVVFHPLYRRILQQLNGRESLAALLTCFFLSCFVLLPLVIFSMLLFQELLMSAQTLTDLAGRIRYDELLQHPLVARPLDWLQRYVDLESLNLRAQLVKVAESTSQFLLGMSTGFFVLFSNFLITLALVELCMLFLFKDGERFLAYLGSLVPLSRDTKQTLSRRIKEVVQTSVLGTFATAGANGLLGGIIFALLGIPSAILWGVLMTLLAFIPLVGAVVIWAPTAAYLILTGDVTRGVMLIAWGLVLMMGFADNMVRPLLLQKVSSDETRLNPLVLFLSIMGGLQLYGLLGIVMGPLIMVVSLTVLEMYRLYFHLPEAETVPEVGLEPLSDAPSLPDRA